MVVCDSMYASAVVCDSVTDDETVAAVCGWVMEGVTVTLCV